MRFQRFPIVICVNCGFRRIFGAPVECSDQVYVVHALRASRRICQNSEELKVNELMIQGSQGRLYIMAYCYQSYLTTVGEPKTRSRRPTLRLVCASRGLLNKCIVGLDDDLWTFLAHKWILGIITTDREVDLVEAK